MKRRKFLQLAGLSGLALTVPTAKRVEAQEGLYGGPYYVLITASGGWDPRFMFDPTTDAEQNRYYAVQGAAGAIPYADWPIDEAAFNIDVGIGYSSYLMTNGAFLAKHGNRLTVINGVDTSTNNHEAGKRTMMSGSIPGKYPAIGALLAAARAPNKPIGFISSGGYDATAGLVPLARVASADSMRDLAFPNEVDPGNIDNTDTYHLAQTVGRIRGAQRERLQALRDAQHLPRLNRSMGALHLARETDSELSRLALPADLADITVGGQLNDLERLMQQSQLAVAGFKSGLAVSASLSLGGFDSHANHDRDQPRQIAKLLYGVDFLMTEAAAAGIDNNMYVVVVSDFARGPRYNGTNSNAGKDHWPVTSMFAMGPNIPGGRLVGATTSDQRARFVDPATMTPADSGVKITPGTVHRALRRVMGIDGHELAQRYPVLGEDLPLFG